MLSTCTMLSEWTIQRYTQTAANIISGARCRALTCNIMSQIPGDFMRRVTERFAQSQWQDSSIQTLGLDCFQSAVASAAGHHHVMQAFSPAHATALPEIHQEHNHQQNREAKLWLLREDRLKPSDSETVLRSRSRDIQAMFKIDCVQREKSNGLFLETVHALPCSWNW